MNEETALKFLGPNLSKGLDEAIGKTLKGGNSAQIWVTYPECNKTVLVAVIPVPQKPSEVEK